MERKFIPGKTFSAEHMGIPQEVVFLSGNSRKIYVPFLTGNFQNFKPEFSVEWRNLRCYSSFMILSFNFQAEYNKDQHHITLELSVKDLEVSLQIIVFALIAPFLTLIAALESLFLASTQHSADYGNLRKDTDLRLIQPLDSHVLVVHKNL